MSLVTLALSLLVTGAQEHADPRTDWDQIEAAPDSVDRCLARAQLLARAGDPAGALESARRGLELDPRSLPLLYQAAYAALWLEYVTAASDYSARLIAAVHESSGDDQSVAQAWMRTATDMETRSRLLSEHLQTREESLSLARWIALGGVAGTFAMIALLATRDARGTTPTAS